MRLTDYAKDARGPAQRRLDTIAARNRSMRECRRLLGQSTWRPMGKDGKLQEPRPL